MNIEQSAFLVSLSPREEVLLAASYLEQIPIPSQFFKPDCRERCERATDTLSRMPVRWATELCREVIHQAAETST